MYTCDTQAPMPDPFHIRPATPADAGTLAVLGERTFRDTFAADSAAEDLDAYVRYAFPSDRVRAELEDEKNTCLLALAGDSGTPLGYAKLRTGAPHPSVTGPAAIELQRLYVDRAVLGRGAGAALMQACLQTARFAGHRTLWLGVWEHNQRALAFYRKWGFRKVGGRVFRLGSDDQTDFIMERPVTWGHGARSGPG